MKRTAAFFSMAGLNAVSWRQRKRPEEQNRCTVDGGGIGDATLGTHLRAEPEWSMTAVSAQRVSQDNGWNNAGTASH